MVCVNMEFYHINIKKNNYAYLKHTKDIQYILSKLLYLERITIIEDIALTLYYFNKYLKECDNILFKKNDFHENFVFDFSLDLWKKFQENLWQESPNSIEMFIFSLSMSFKKTMIVLKLNILYQNYLYICDGIHI